MPSDNETHLTELKQSEPTYSESDLRDIFNDLNGRSFTEIRNTTELIFKDMNSLGYASPFSLNLYIDIDRVNKYQWPEEAVIGLFAHELGHIVSYERRSFLNRMLFIWDYYLSDAARREVEHEADLIAIERGYGKELIQTRRHAIRDYDEERVKKMEKTYYWPDDLERILSSRE